MFDNKCTPPSEQAAANILSQLSSLSGPQRAATKLIAVAPGMPALPKKLVDQIKLGITLILVSCLQPKDALAPCPTKRVM